MLCVMDKHDDEDGTPAPFERRGDDAVLTAEDLENAKRLMWLVTKPGAFIEVDEVI